LTSPFLISPYRPASHVHVWGIFGCLELFRLIERKVSISFSVKWNIKFLLNNSSLCILDLQIHQFCPTSSLTIECLFQLFQIRSYSKIILHPPIGLAVEIIGGRNYYRKKSDSLGVVNERVVLGTKTCVAFGLHTNLGWSPPEIAPVTNPTHCQVA